MTNQPHGTLYVGVTSDIQRRVWEHREGLAEGFTKRYGLKRLVYAEWHDDIESAIRREKRFKHWPRQWKINLIEGSNPDRADLYDTLLWDKALRRRSMDAPDKPGHDVKEGWGYMGGKLSTGQWIFAGIGFVITLVALRDIIPPGTLGLPNIILAGIKGGIGAGIGLLAWEAIQRMRGGGNGDKDGY